MRDLFAGMTRFEDIRRDLGIASNILAVRLEELEHHGVVERRQYQNTPARYEYVLTDKGRDLYPVVATLLAWGDKWLSAPDGPPALTVHTDCGNVNDREDGVRRMRRGNCTPATRLRLQDPVPKRGRAPP